MKTKAGLLVTTLLTLAGLAFGAPAYAKNDKVALCHMTGSVKNPSVIINVSSKAAAGHYAHGDPAEYVVLPNGECVADSEPPPEQVPLQACSSLGPLPIPSYLWTVVYYPESGTFSGTAVGHTQGALEGTVSQGGPIFTTALTLSDVSVGTREGASSAPGYTVFMDATVPPGNLHVVFPVTLAGTSTLIAFTAPSNVCKLEAQER